MNYLVLALVEMVGTGITVHAWDTGNLNMMISGIGFALLFLMWGLEMAIEEVNAE
jgi:hypothetical protein